MKSIYLYRDGSIRIDIPLVGSPTPFVEFAMIPKLSDVAWDAPDTLVVSNVVRFRFVAEASGAFYVFEEVETRRVRSTRRAAIAASDGEPDGPQETPTYNGPQEAAHRMDQARRLK